MWSILIEKKKIHIHYNNLYEITIFVDPSLVIITIHLVCLIYAWE